MLKSTCDLIEMRQQSHRYPTLGQSTDPETSPPPTMTTREKINCLLEREEDKLCRLEIQYGDLKRVNEELKGIIGEKELVNARLKERPSKREMVDLEWENKDLKDELKGVRRQLMESRQREKAIFGEKELIMSRLQERPTKSELEDMERENMDLKNKLQRVRRELIEIRQRETECAMEEEWMIQSTNSAQYRVSFSSSSSSGYVESCIWQSSL